MVVNKSLDEYTLIAALLRDISDVHNVVFNTRALRLTLEKVKARCLSEGLGFLTKTLPKLGKAFDRALSAQEPLNATKVGFDTLPQSQLPMFLGELFKLVLDDSGSLLSEPCVRSVKHIRQVCYLFYKYELPYTAEQTQKVIDSFKKNEADLQCLSSRFQFMERLLDSTILPRMSSVCKTDLDIVRVARRLLSELFRGFDPFDIVPRHGPGVVATKQQRSDKYRWTNVSKRITDVFPLDAFFYASLSHVCDDYRAMNLLDNVDYPAQVILVPKDSRGPRLISAEPVDFQWVQQGLREALYRLVEHHPLTRYSVFFTDQVPNQKAALLGSYNGSYATLDLKDASDRVHLDLVRVLFPSNVFKALEAARSLQTRLPSGEVIKLSKYAPMGSALCFPVMAITIWALLQAGLCDDSFHPFSGLDEIHVYGDDVIVPTAKAERAINILESFGLKVNHDKSCTKGSFRESCGVDAFKGSDVTPLKLRTVWKSSPSADCYESYCAYAHWLYNNGLLRSYDVIVDLLLAVYGSVPSVDAVGLTAPSLPTLPINGRPIRRRWSTRYQRFEYLVRVVKPVKRTEHLPGWSKLLRFFTESRPVSTDAWDKFDKLLIGVVKHPEMPLIDSIPDRSSRFSVSSYTRRHSSMLEWRWR